VSCCLEGVPSWEPIGAGTSDVHVKVVTVRRG
jgi:hypothetical protein